MLHVTYMLIVISYSTR